VPSRIKTDNHVTTMEQESPWHLSRGIWIAAMLGAVAIHATCAALAFGFVQPPSDDDLGAPAIEIGIELMSPKIDPTNLPVGPDTDASAPSPAVVEQKENLDPSNLPKAPSTDTDDPDRVVSPTDSKKVTETPKTITPQTSPSEQSLATEATAMPTVNNAAESPRSVAPSPGTGESAVRARVTWEKELVAHFDKFKRYPADRAMQSAQVVVSFVLDRAGHIVSSQVATGSGDQSFDSAAIAMLQRSDPVPPPPPLVADQGLTFTLPIFFHIKSQN
jgi:periplasmic protein TonB